MPPRTAPAYLGSQLVTSQVEGADVIGRANLSQQTQACDVPCGRGCLQEGKIAEDNIARGHALTLLTMIHPKRTPS
jgi:hypothetical protein